MALGNLLKYCVLFLSISLLAACDERDTNEKHARLENNGLLEKREQQDGIQGIDIFEQFVEKQVHNNDDIDDAETRETMDRRETSEDPDTQLMKEENDNSDHVQGLNTHQMIHELVGQVREIARNVRNLQDKMDAINLESDINEENQAVRQDGLLASPTLNRVKREEARGRVSKMIEDIRDATYLMAISLVKRESIPYYPSCSDPSDVSSCLRPKVSDLYKDLNVPVRIAAGPNAYMGRVELLYNGRWTTICNQGWDSKDARVACKMLGYSGGYNKVGTEFYFQSRATGLQLISNVQCTGDEDSLLSCKFDKAPYSCGHYDDAGLECNVD